MSYVSSIERLAKIEANRENIIKTLQTRFGTISKLSWVTLRLTQPTRAQDFTKAKD